MTRHTLYAPLVFLAMLALSGCVAMVQAPTCITPPHAQRQAWAQSMPFWTQRGSLQIVTKHQKWRAHWVWRQRRDRYTILVSGPLGMGSVRIDGEPGNVVLRQGRQHWEATSAEQLMQQQLGWHLPISQLRYWLWGTGMPGVANYRQRFDAFSQLQEVHAGGWRVHISGYYCSQSLAPTRPHHLKLINTQQAQVLDLSIY